MLLPTALLRTGMPNRSYMWLTGRICGPAQPFATGNWSQDLVLKFLLLLVIKKKVFVKFVDATKQTRLKLKYV